MGTFQKVLVKAQQEGNIDPRLLSVNKDRYRQIELFNQQLKLPPQLTHLSDDVLKDLQKITENIRQTAAKQLIQTIGFISAIPGQGTSTLIALLSLLMAAREKFDFRELERKGLDKHNHNKQLGLLLIDSQLQNPTLHKKIKMVQNVGLTDIFEKGIPSTVAVKNVPYSPLKIVTAGNNNNFRFTQSNLERLYWLLKSAKKWIEFIFLDLPPVLSSSEGVSLSRLCDGVIMVVRAGSTRWEVVHEASRVLEKAGVNVLGGIINRRKYHIPAWAYKNL